MKKTSALAIGVLFFISMLSPAYASALDWLRQTTSSFTSTKLSDTKIGAGLKEALRVGIENAIKLLGKNDGYFANEAVKILMPDSLKKAEPILRGIGFGPKIDELVLSMNRAAEKAAPLAADTFSSAITDMSIEDAKKILAGGNDSATEYFKEKTRGKLLDLFMPLVAKSMEDYTVTKKFEDITAKIKSVPFLGQFQGLDINRYVASKALDGLFLTLAKEEKKIRTDPAARVTDLLKEVFK